MDKPKMLREFVIEGVRLEADIGHEPEDPSVGIFYSYSYIESVWIGDQNVTDLLANWVEEEIIAQYEDKGDPDDPYYDDIEEALTRR